MKKALTTLLMGFALVSCSTPEPRPTPAQFDFSSMGKLTLNTEDVQVVNRAYSVPTKAPYVGHLFEPRLADVLEKWGSQRLQAAGSAGHATLIIKDASVTQQSLPTEGGLTDVFTRQQASKYVGRIEVAFEAQNPQEHTTGLASANAVHAVTLPEDPTEPEKYAAYKSLVDALMKDLNNAFTQSVKDRMSRFLTSAPAGMSGSYGGSYSGGSMGGMAPVSAAPIAAPVAPAPMAPTPIVTPVSSAPISSSVASVPDPDIQFGPAPTQPIKITSP